LERNEEALRVAHETDDAHGECDALTGLARIALRDGRYDDVVALARQGRERAQAAGDREAEASPLHLQAAGIRLLQDYPAARELYMESLDLNAVVGNTAWVAMELDCLGWVELHLGNVDAATERFREHDARASADDPRKLESAATEWKRLHCSAMGCESGRQDSNLRPLVPQTSTYFPARAEFDLEWFRGEMVGITTSARVMESVGIVWT